MNRVFWRSSLFFIFSLLVFFSALAVPETIFAAEPTTFSSIVATGQWVFGSAAGLFSSGVGSLAGSAGAGALYWAVLGIGWLMLQFSGFFFGMVAVIFDYVIVHTITEFGSFYAQIKEPLESVWSAFRDLANIAIIGAFVFVAISTILGIQSFGYQKFLAKLLIVAVLINFSLYFAKLSIDVSHIFAAQFYKAMVLQPVDAGSNTSISSGLGNTTQSPAPTGIAGAFTKSLGLTSWSGDYETLKKVGGKDGDTFRMAAYAFSATSLLFVATLVFAYAIYLLISRGATLLFLVMLSGLAFATLAIPKLDYWWKKWYTTFIKNLFFAPLLMLLLWASLALSRAMANPLLGQSNATLGSIATNPAAGGTAAILFNYLIIMALLIGSIHIAKTLSIMGSKNVPDWKDLARRGSLQPLQLTGSGIGFLLRNSLGRTANFAYRKSEWASRAANDGGNSQLTRRLAGAYLTSLQATRKVSFNPNRIPEIASSATKKILKDYGLDSDGKGGFAETYIRKNKRLLAAKDKPSTSSEVWDSEKKVRAVAEERKVDKDVEESMKQGALGGAEQQQVFANRIVEAVNKKQANFAQTNARGEYADYQGRDQERKLLNSLLRAERLGDKQAIAIAEKNLSLGMNGLSISDARKQAIANVQKDTSALINKLANTQEGRESLAGVMGEVTKEIQNLGKSNAANMLAAKHPKYQGNYVGAYSKVEDLVRSKRQSSQNKGLADVLNSTKS